MIELSEKNKEYVNRVLKGDILDMPALHKQDVEKISYYCIGHLKEEVNTLNVIVEVLTSSVDRLIDKHELLVEQVDDILKKRGRR